MSELWDETRDKELRQMEAEMAGELADLRSAATVYAERVRARSGQPETPGMRLGPGWRRWAIAGVAALLIAGGGVGVLQHRAPVAANGEAAAAVQERQADAVSDEALLEQVQRDLSTGVPAAMQPLEASDFRSAAVPAAESR